MSEPEIFIVDDDSGMRESLHFMLESHGFAVESFGSATAFLDTDFPDCAGCLVVDVRLPEMSGLELQQRLNDRHSRLRLVVITGHADVSMAVNAMKAGAVDFIEKPFSEDALLESIGRALEQSRQLAAAVVVAAPDGLGERLASLTAREREVLDQLVTGNPHKVIARKLDISPRTIEVHRARIMQKLEAGNLADLVRMMIATGVQRAED